MVEHGQEQPITQTPCRCGKITGVEEREVKGNQMDFRERAIQLTRKHLSNGRHTVLVGPTGCGKTRMALNLVDGRRVLWITHTRELVDQAAAAFREHTGCKVQALGGSRPSLEPDAQVYVTTIQSLVLMRNRPPAELLIWDECHHAPAETWSQVVESYPSAVRLGLTATPERGDGKPLGDMFDELVLAAQTAELIKLGFLVEPWVYRPSIPLQGQLAISATDAVLTYSQGDPTFVFADRVHRAYQVADELRRNRIKAKVIEAETHWSTRKLIMQEFNRGDVQALVSVNALTEGVDAPRAACAVLARTFGTPSSLIQATGRVLRPYPGKTHARVIDLTGSTHLVGLPDDVRGFSLTGSGITVGTGTGSDDDIEREAPIRISPEVIGMELVPVGSAPPIEFDVTKYRETSTDERWKEFLIEGLAKGRRRLAIAAQYARRFGEWPPMPNTDLR